MTSTRAPFRTLDDFWRYVANATDYEKRVDFTVDRKTFDLDRMRSLVERMGRPDAAFPIVHIAGTNGKGSVAHLTAALLSGAGHRVGLFTSPHLVDVRERIRIDGAPLAERPWLAGMERLAPLFDEAGATFFEMMTALALDSFREAGVDVAVLEVGLGGRLDATNVCHPVATAVTSIDLDHTLQLGSTVEAIAAEKAAILEPGVPVVHSVADGPARRVIEDRAVEIGAPIHALDADIDVEIAEIYLEGGSRFHVGTWRRGYTSLALPIPGRAAVRSAAVALGLVEVLAERGLVDLTSATARPALAGVRLAGRCQRVEGAPAVLLDGAHNPAAMARLIATLDEFFPDRRPVVLLGLLADKDLAGLLAALERVERLVATEVESPRSLRASDLAAATGRPVEAEPDALRAFDRLRAALAPEEILVVTGSFYLVGQILRERYPGSA